jgi:peptidoglycan DL-endopeptidase CwlO
MRRPLLKCLLAALALFACGPRPGIAFGGQGTTDSIDQRALFRSVGAMYGFDPDLFEAIAAVESHHDPFALSGKGAMGLMQLMPATAQRFKVSDPFDPVESVLGAARLLDYLRGQQIWDIPALLAAYNAGEGAVKRYHGIPPYAETREYVRAVLRLYLLGTVPPDRREQYPQVGTNSREQNTGVVRTSASGDQVVLDQLANVKRNREIAARAR